MTALTLYALGAIVTLVWLYCLNTFSVFSGELLDTRTGQKRVWADEDLITPPYVAAMCAAWPIVAAALLVLVVVIAARSWYGYWQAVDTSKAPRQHVASCAHGDCWCRPGSDGT